MRGEMECEGAFVGHAQGIVLEVGGKVDVDEVVGEDSRESSYWGRSCWRG